MGRDRRIIYAAAFLRALASGMVAVLIGIYVAKLGYDPARTGIVVGAGLAGGAVAALIVTLRGNRIARRRTLVVLSILGACGGVAVSTASSLPLIAAGAFLGMLNGMGRDRGASLIIDQAILPATASDADRTKAFAWYNVVQDAGHALGGLLAATPALLRPAFGLGDVGALRVTLAGYAAILLATGVVYAALSRGVEPREAREAREERIARHAPVSPQTRRVLWKLSSLFAIDSLAGGFLVTALLAFFFYRRFGASEVAVGVLFFAARVANAGSHLGAAWLAKRIGLVNTMVFTHIPSSLLLVAVPFAPNLAVAAALFLLREILVEMDVPTRQSYVMAVVTPDERIVASGVTHLVRVGGWAVAPTFAGFLMGGVGLGTPLFIGAAMKIGYDLLLYAAFRSHRPPEERPVPGA